MACKFRCASQSFAAEAAKEIQIHFFRRRVRREKFLSVCKRRSGALRAGEALQQAAILSVGKTQSFQRG